MDHQGVVESKEGRMSREDCYMVVVRGNGVRKFGVWLIVLVYVGTVNTVAGGVEPAPPSRTHRNWDHLAATG